MRIKYNKTFPSKKEKPVRLEHLKRNNKFSDFVTNKKHYCIKTTMNRRLFIA
jgi:hypothetical protein